LNSVLLDGVGLDWLVASGRILAAAWLVLCTTSHPLLHLSCSMAGSACALGCADVLSASLRRSRLQLQYLSCFISLLEFLASAAVVPLQCMAAVQMVTEHGPAAPAACIAVLVGPEKTL
jgi:hypothetical protein